MTTDTSTFDNVEDHVAALWRKALNRDEVPHDAHFAELGGDSLLLLSIVDQLEDAYDLELDVERVVEDLTVSGMAKVVDTSRSQES